MSGRLNEIKGIRDSVLVIDASEYIEEQEPIDEGKRVRTKKRRGAKASKARAKARQSYRSKAAQISRKMKKKRKTSAYQKAQAEIERLGPSRKGTRRMTNKAIRRKTAPVAEEFEAWIQDVDEAVDLFIGMPLEVLPRMPWERWFQEGMSPVVAAKNAVQMHEDMDEDDEYDDGYDDDDDNWDDDDYDEISERSVDAYPETGMNVSDYLQDLMGIKKPRNPRMQSYQKWANELSKKLKRKSGETLESLKQEGLINNKMIHSWYMSGYHTSKSAKILADALKKISKKKAQKESIGDRAYERKKQLRENAQSLGMRGVNSDAVPKSVPKSKMMNQFLSDAAQLNEKVTDDMIGEAVAACSNVISSDKSKQPVQFVESPEAAKGNVTEDSEIVLEVDENGEAEAPEGSFEIEAADEGGEPEGVDNNDE